MSTSFGRIALERSCVTLSVENRTGGKAGHMLDGRGVRLSARASGRSLCRRRCDKMRDRCLVIGYWLLVDGCWLAGSTCSLTGLCWCVGTSQATVAASHQAVRDPQQPIASNR